MRSQPRPRIGSYIKVIVPDPGQRLPYGLVGQVVGYTPTSRHSGAASIHVRFPGGEAVVDYRTTRTLGSREVAQALGLTVPQGIAAI
jgi:hypothetical protein